MRKSAAVSALSKGLIACCIVFTFGVLSYGSARAGTSDGRPADSAARAAQASSDTLKPMSIGLFIGKIEEGARIFTPIRLIPKWQPDSKGHEFPNALQFQQKEYEALVYLGELDSLKLTATLQRYPKPPTPDWWYAQFPEYPLEKVRAAKVHRVKQASAPIPGVKVIAFVDGRPLGWIVDTRDLTLKERGMSRATTAGLDLTRDQFLTGLNKARPLVKDTGDCVIVFSR